MPVTEPRAFLRRLFEAAVAAADPAVVVPAALPAPPRGRTVVVGAGKAAAAMAEAVEAHWPGELGGLVVTRRGTPNRCRRIEVIEAAHPVPDEGSLAAGRRLLAAVQGLGPDDLVIALVSGGGSALLTLPAPGLALADKQAVNRQLLASGMPIQDMNCLRKHLSAIKGGRLAAAAAPARVVSLVLSDIPGDDPALVASGPTIPDGRGREAALQLVARYGLDLPAAVRRHLASPEADAPRPDDPRFARNEVRLVASASLSLEAAAALAEQAGVPAHILTTSLEGEAREVAKMHAAIATEILERGRPFARPVLLLSGGETTVTVRGQGKGGRNSEFLLALALGLAGREGVTAIAADTDGIDGSEDNAGAFADGTTVARLRAAGHDPFARLAANDAWTAFAALGDLLVTGPTRTNVNDFRAILVEA